jgi:hypothetical protein
VCAKFAGGEIGLVQVGVIAGALVACTLMWWLYFDTLTHYAEHRPHRGVGGVHVHYTALHLVILTGLVSFGLGLRTIAEEMGEGHDVLGPELSPVAAASLALGLAAYLAGITLMWSLLRRPRGRARPDPDDPGAPAVGARRDQRPGNSLGTPQVRLRRFSASRGKLTA